MADLRLDAIIPADQARPLPPNDPAAAAPPAYGPIRTAINANVPLLIFTILSLCVCGVLPGCVRGGLATDHPSTMPVGFGKIWLDGLRAWEASIMVGVLPVVWAGVWYVWLEGRTQFPPASWVPFVLRTLADCTLWSMGLAILTSIWSNLVADPIIIISHP